ncbi:MAG: nucleotidyl transferase AbiEii/AbiGii toxin family protein [Bacteroidales bacterium]|nr:nucleotidyl transferase AbiEii/AbiGii toxin family protein [Bacteroidales bacterium]
MLYKETVGLKIFNLIKEIQGFKKFSKFYLAGGTALSLQFGHRKSIDIDLFTEKDFNHIEINNFLKEKYKNRYKNSFLDINSCGGFIDGIKIDILAHKYKLLDNPIEKENVKFLGLNDISAMKVNAIYSDGSRVKDFIDIYFLLDKMSLNDIIENFRRKYNSENSYYATKSIVYFDDVRLNDFPVITDKKIKWKDIKSRLIKTHESIIKNKLKKS